MGNWLKDVKDSDKVGLLLLFTGLVVAFCGTGFAVFSILRIHEEATIDRLLLTIGIFTAQGTGLVTAAMGVLRFQEKKPSSDQTPPEPPASNKEGS